MQYKIFADNPASGVAANSTAQAGESPPIGRATISSSPGDRPNGSATSAVQTRQTLDLTSQVNLTQNALPAKHRSAILKDRALDLSPAKISLKKTNVTKLDDFIHDSAEKWHNFKAYPYRQTLTMAMDFLVAFSAPILVISGVSNPFGVAASFLIFSTFVIAKQFFDNGMAIYDRATRWSEISHGDPFVEVIALSEQIITHFNDPKNKEVSELLKDLDSGFNFDKTLKSLRLSYAIDSRKVNDLDQWFQKLMQDALDKDDQKAYGQLKSIWFTVHRRDNTSRAGKLSRELANRWFIELPIAAQALSQALSGKTGVYLHTDSGAPVLQINSYLKQAEFEALLSWVKSLEMTTEAMHDLVERVKIAYKITQKYSTADYDDQNHSLKPGAVFQNNPTLLKFFESNSKRYSFTEEDGTLKVVVLSAIPKEDAVRLKGEVKPEEQAALQLLIDSSQLIQLEDRITALGEQTSTFGLPEDVPRAMLRSAVIQRTGVVNMIHVLNNDSRHIFQATSQGLVINARRVEARMNTILQQMGDKLEKAMREAGPKQYISRNPHELAYFFSDSYPPPIPKSMIFAEAVAEYFPADGNQRMVMNHYGRLINLHLNKHATDNLYCKDQKISLEESHPAGEIYIGDALLEAAREYNAEHKVYEVSEREVLDFAKLYVARAKDYAEQTILAGIIKKLQDTRQMTAEDKATAITVLTNKFQLSPEFLENVITELIQNIDVIESETEALLSQDTGTTKMNMVSAITFAKGEEGARRLVELFNYARTLIFIDKAERAPYQQEMFAKDLATQKNSFIKEQIGTAQQKGGAKMGGTMGLFEALRWDISSAVRHSISDQIMAQRRADRLANPISKKVEDSVRELRDKVWDAQPHPDLDFHQSESGSAEDIAIIKYVGAIMPELEKTFDASFGRFSSEVADLIIARRVIDPVFAKLNPFDQYRVLWEEKYEQFKVAIFAEDSELRDVLNTHSVAGTPVEIERLWEAINESITDGFISQWSTAQGLIFQINRTQKDLHSFNPAELLTAREDEQAEIKDWVGLINNKHQQVSKLKEDLKTSMSTDPEFYDWLSSLVEDLKQHKTGEGWAQSYGSVAGFYDVEQMVKSAELVKVVQKLLGHIPLERGQRNHLRVPVTALGDTTGSLNSKELVDSFGHRQIVLKDFYVLQASLDKAMNGEISSLGTRYSQEDIQKFLTDIAHLKAQEEDLKIDLMVSMEERFGVTHEFALDYSEYAYTHDKLDAREWFGPTIAKSKISKYSEHFDKIKYLFKDNDINPEQLSFKDDKDFDITKAIDALSKKGIPEKLISILRQPQSGREQAFEYFYSRENHQSPATAGAELSRIAGSYLNEEPAPEPSSSVSDFSMFNFHRQPPTEAKAQKPQNYNFMYYGRQPSEQVKMAINVLSKRWLAQNGALSPTQLWNQIKGEMLKDTISVNAPTLPYRGVAYPFWDEIEAWLPNMDAILPKSYRGNLGQESNERDDRYPLINQMFEHLATARITELKAELEQANIGERADLEFRLAYAYKIKFSTQTPGQINMASNAANFDKDNWPTNFAVRPIVATYKPDNNGKIIHKRVVLIQGNQDLYFALNNQLAMAAGVDMVDAKLNKFHLEGSRGYHSVTGCGGWFNRKEDRLYDLSRTVLDIQTAEPKRKSPVFWKRFMAHSSAVAATGIPLLAISSYLGFSGIVAPGLLIAIAPVLTYIGLRLFYNKILTKGFAWFREFDEAMEDSDWLYEKGRQFNQPHRTPFLRVLGSLMTAKASGFRPVKVIKRCEHTKEYSSVEDYRTRTEIVKSLLFSLQIPSEIFQAEAEGNFDVVVEVQFPRWNNAHLELILSELKDEKYFREFLKANHLSARVFGEYIQLYREAAEDNRYPLGTMFGLDFSKTINLFLLTGVSVFMFSDTAITALLAPLISYVAVSLGITASLATINMLSIVFALGIFSLISMLQYFSVKKHISDHHAREGTNRFKEKVGLTRFVMINGTLIGKILETTASLSKAPFITSEPLKHLMSRTAEDLYFRVDDAKAEIAKLEKGLNDAIERVRGELRPKLFSIDLGSTAERKKVKDLLAEAEWRYSFGKLGLLSIKASFKYEYYRKKLPKLAMDIYPYWFSYYLSAGAGFFIAGGLGLVLSNIAGRLSRKPLVKKVAFWSPIMSNALYTQLRFFMNSNSLSTNLIFGVMSLGMFYFIWRTWLEYDKNPRDHITKGSLGVEPQKEFRKHSNSKP